MISNEYKELSIEKYNPVIATIIFFITGT